jgi:serine/threonine protein kinase
VPPQPEVGSSASSYEILAKLATGGMAEIFLARGASTAGIERYVVLKRILRERATDAAFVRMFLDEAKLAAQLQHPNIAQVYDIGKLGDSYFFTMEYVHGETVRALLHRSHGLKRPIPVGSVLAVAAGAASGLHHAHERIGMDGKHLGIVHRDVSPSNLMVSYEGTVKLVDFGVAKAALNSQETRSGTVKGKIAYLSPEQCRGRPIDRRSDLFSLGIVMWEMLTTERLFRHPSDFETMASIVNEPTPPPSSRRPDVPAELDQLVLRLLAKEPEDRYQNAGDVVEDIEQLAVRAGAVLSTAGLGRVVRELFGQRPEPWVEMKSSEEHAHVVTVTSEPVPADFGLESVPSLQAPRPSDLRPTVPLRVDVLEAVPIAPMPAADASLPVPSQPVMSQTLMSTAPPMPAMAPSPFSPNTVSGSNPFSQTGSVHAQMQSPFGTTGSVSAHAAPVAKKRPVVVWVLVAAALVGVVLGLALGLGGSKKQNKPADEGSAVAMVSIDAAPAVVAVDAAVPMAADAEVPVVVDAAAPVAIDATEKAEHHPTKKPPEDLAAMKPADAVTACAASTSLFAANPVTCTVAACKAHELSRAKRWLASVPSAKRGSVTSACPALAPKVDNSEACKRDPLACQH